LSGKFTLLDFKEQLRAMRKMGPLSKILELLPGGLAFKVSSAELQLTETKIKKWMAALDSMTEEELLSPSIIDRSRIRRIAKGAGVTTKDIKDLLTTYNLIKKQLKRVSKRRFKYMQSFFGV
ncbi:MAG: signal recognition particle protein Srp19, partial [Thermoprotei archaeon]